MSITFTGETIKGQEVQMPTDWQKAVTGLGRTALMASARVELNGLLQEKKKHPHKTPAHDIDSLSALDNYLTKEGTQDEAEAYRHIKNQWRTAFFEIAAAYGHKSTVRLLWDASKQDFSSGGIGQTEMLVNGIDDRLPQEQYRRTYLEGANGILVKNLYKNGFFNKYSLVEISAIPEKKIPGVEIYDFKKMKYFIRYTEVVGDELVMHSLSMVNCDMKVLNEVFQECRIIGPDEWLDSTKMLGHPFAVPKDYVRGPEPIAQKIDITMDPSGSTFLGRPRKPEDNYSKIEEISQWREQRLEQDIVSGTNKLINIAKQRMSPEARDAAYRKLLKGSLLTMFAANPDIAADIFDEETAELYRTANRLEKEGRVTEAREIRDKLNESLEMPPGCPGKLDDKKDKMDGLVQSVMDMLLGKEKVTCICCGESVEAEYPVIMRKNEEGVMEEVLTIRDPGCAHWVVMCDGEVLNQGNKKVREPEQHKPEDADKEKLAAKAENAKWN